MCSRTGSRSLRTSSGSRSAISSIDPLRSANRMVTSLRSPSSTALGSSRPPVFTTALVAVAAATGCPHSRQNLADAGSSVPQAVHVNDKVTAAIVGLEAQVLSIGHRGSLICAGEQITRRTELDALTAAHAALQ